MGFENWPNVHARWHTERVKNDIYRCSVLMIGHILHGNDPRDHAFVAMAASHLIARLQLAFHRDKDLDHLHHAGWQFIAPLNLIHLIDKPVLQTLFTRIELFFQGFKGGHDFVIFDDELGQLTRRMFGQNRLRDTRSYLNLLGPADDCVIKQYFLQPLTKAALQDSEFVVAVLGKQLYLFPLDRKRTLILIDAAP